MVDDGWSPWRCYCLHGHIFGVWSGGVFRLPLLLLFIALKFELNALNVGPSPRCAANNCKILNHNFRFLLRFKFIGNQPQGHILFGRSPLPSFLFFSRRKCIKPILFSRKNDTKRMILKIYFLLFHRRRLWRTGSSYRWCWTASFSGSSRCPVCSGPWP